MTTAEGMTDSELWTLPYDSLMEILELEAMERIAGMTGEELRSLYEDAMKKRNTNCDIRKIAEQSDEENHECIRLSVLQNAIIDQTRELMFAEEYPDLYQSIRQNHTSFREIVKALTGPRTVNGEQVHHAPSFEEVIEFIYAMQAAPDSKKYA